MSWSHGANGRLCGPRVDHADCAWVMGAVSVARAVAEHGVGERNTWVSCGRCACWRRMGGCGAPDPKGRWRGCRKLSGVNALSHSG